MVEYGDSYAASRKQQSLPLFPGVACGKLPLPMIIQGTVVQSPVKISLFVTVP